MCERMMMMISRPSFCSTQSTSKGMTLIYTEPHETRLSFILYHEICYKQPLLEEFDGNTKRAIWVLQNGFNNLFRA